MEWLKLLSVGLSLLRFYNDVMASLCFSLLYQDRHLIYNNDSDGNELLKNDITLTSVTLNNSLRV